MLPMKTQRARWFDDPNFTSHVRMPPEIPRLDVTVATDGPELTKHPSWYA
jgi:hypothetical protein